MKRSPVWRNGILACLKSTVYVGSSPTAGTRKGLPFPTGWISLETAPGQLGETYGLRGKWSSVCREKAL